jgi:hypothetical protein
MTLRHCRGYASPTHRQAAHDLPDDPANFYGAKTRCRACERAYSADYRAARDTSGAASPVPQPGKMASRGTRPGRLEPVLDGLDALERLVRRAGFPSVMAAVAANTLFLHPDTVRQTNGHPLFWTIRDPVNRRSIGTLADGRRVYLDDNQSPTLAFLWSAGRGKGRDIQFNHVWARSDDPLRYTALWNLCVTPAFLAKTTDGSNNPDIQAALRRRSYDLFGFKPIDEPVPAEPPGYRDLDWRLQPPPALPDLQGVLRERLAANQGSSPAASAREFGWLGNGWQPGAGMAGG